MDGPSGAPIRVPRFFSPAACAGWTLTELVIVVSVASIMTTIVVVRSLPPKQPQATLQAERLRDDLRHMQLLAMTWDQSLRLTVTAAAGPNPARYSVSCVTAGAAPCNTSPVLDPRGSGAFQVDLETGLDLGLMVGAGASATLDMDSLGRPRLGAALISANATFTISGGGVTRTAVLQPLTGFATAQ
jgi:MSHA pilin protein MshC